MPRGIALDACKLRQVASYLSTMKCALIAMTAHMVYRRVLRKQ